MNTKKEKEKKERKLAMSPQKTITWFAILLGGLMLACRFGNAANRPVTPTPTLEPVEVSQAAADRFKDKIKIQVLDSSTTQFSLTVTDEEITSFVALYGSQLPLSHPQIHFGAGKIYLSGETELGVTAPVFLVAGVTLHDGQVKVQIVEARVGQLAMPDTFRQQISTTINESIQDASSTVRIMSVQITPGQITLQGTKGNSDH